MTALTAIAAGEFRNAWRNGSAWLLLAFATGLLAWGMLHGIDAFTDAASQRAALPDAPGVGEAIIAPHLANSAWILLLLAPLLSLRSIGTEQRRGTLDLLYAAGASPLAVVAGKWLAIWAQLILIATISVAMAASLALGSTPDPGRLLAGLAGLALLSGALAAIGVAASALFGQPALAAAGAFAIELALWLVDAPARARGVTDGLINFLALPTHVSPFLRGMVSAGDALWLVALALGFVLIAWRRLAWLRARG